MRNIGFNISIVITELICFDPSKIFFSIINLVKLQENSLKNSIFLSSNNFSSENTPKNWNSKNSPKMPKSF